VSGPAAVVRTTALSLGEWHISADPEESLACIGLGSCVAFVAWDPVAGLAGMAHMVLPDSTQGRESATAPAKFVDTAIPLVVDRMTARGARRERLRIHLVGGAGMLQGVQRTNSMNIGERNTIAARAAVRALGLRVYAEATGGGHGRTVRLSVADGSMTISSPGSSAVAA
jgi:chemotaxis protein CheD